MTKVKNGAYLPTSSGYTEENDEWNTAIFDQRISNSPEWQDKRQNINSKPRRIQDLAVSVLSDSSGDSFESNDYMIKTSRQYKEEQKQWPFEEPCRMFGGKNTKDTVEADIMNKEYFDPNFADRVKHTEFDNDTQDTNSKDDHDMQTTSSMSISEPIEKDNNDDSDDEDDNSFADDDNDETANENEKNSGKKKSESEGVTTRKGDAKMEVDEERNNGESSNAKKPTSRAGHPFSASTVAATSTRIFMPRRGSTGIVRTKSADGMSLRGRRSSLAHSASSRNFSSRTSHDDDDHYDDTAVEKEPKETSQRGPSRFRLSRTASQPNLNFHRMRSNSADYAPQETHEEGEEEDTDTRKQIETSRASERASKHRRRPSNELGHTMDVEQQQPHNKVAEEKPRRRGSTDKGVSTDPTAPSQEPVRRSGRSSRGSGLDSATYHGDLETDKSARTGARAAPASRRSGAPARHKSSDDPAMMPGGHYNQAPARRNYTSRHDELGTATLHGTSGKSAVSQFRRGNTTKSSGSDAGNNASKEGSSRTGRRSSVDAKGEEKRDRRAEFKRAMSTENVRRPEEYGPNGAVGNSDSGNDSAFMTKRRGGRRIRSSGSSAEELTQQHQHNENVSPPQKPRRRGDKETFDSSNDEEDHDQNSDDESFAGDQEEQIPSRSSRRRQTEVIQSSASSSRRGARRQSLDADANTQNKKEVIGSSDTRHVLELLRDQKTVKARDLQDKYNRSIVHFLLYEHKLGISLAQMKKNVQQEIEEDRDEALRRVNLPLFVPDQNN